MTPWPATIKKRTSADGFWVLRDPTLVVGAEIEVDIDSRRMQKYRNNPTGKLFECEIVNVIGGPLEDIPTELLEL